MGEAHGSESALAWRVWHHRAASCIAVCCSVCCGVIPCIGERGITEQRVGEFLRILPLMRLRVTCARVLRICVPTPYIPTHMHRRTNTHAKARIHNERSTSGGGFKLNETGKSGESMHI